MKKGIKKTKKLFTKKTKFGPQVLLPHVVPYGNESQEEAQKRLSDRAKSNMIY